MGMGRFSTYKLKKAFGIWPGVAAPVSAGFLSDHYAVRRRERSAPRAALDALVGTLFKAWVPIRARSIAAKYELGDQWAKQATRIGRARFADPNDLALFRVERGDELDSFMRRFEYSAISKRINPACWRDDCALADKVLFYARAKQHGLPHPAVLAVIRRGRIEIADVPATGTIAIKPGDGEGGDGFRVAEWLGGNEDQFAAFLKAQPGLRSGTWIVQPKVAPHPDIKDIAMSALPTARVTTIRDEQGKPELVTSVLRFPSVPDALIDNIKAGGLMAPIAPDTGVLGAACRGKKAGEVALHPVTGAPVAGKQLPDWDAVKALVLKAHGEAFPEYLMVGWDVAFTPHGPMLIEGNGKPCIVVAQRATGRGIGETRFGALVRHHLAIADGQNREGA